MFVARRQKGEYSGKTVHVGWLDSLGERVLEGLSRLGGVPRFGIFFLRE